MKKTLLLLFSLTFLLQSCLSDDCTQTEKFVRYNPVMVSAQDFRSKEIKTSTNQPLENPGKIYFYKNHLLINEQGRGIHFFDMSNPSLPQEVVFYHILGNFDMAIQDDKLYADNVIDLIQIDLSDIKKPKLVNRINNYEKQYNDTPLATYPAYYTRTNEVVVLDCNQNNFNGNWGFTNNRFFASFDIASSTPIVNSGATNVGVGGSTARFTLLNSHLYTVNSFNLMTWKLPELTNTQTKNLGWGIETIFPYKDFLFIGSTTGMFTFDAKDPSNPILKARFSHARACDPVVANDTRAYVTLRSGNACAGNNNQLDIINVEDISNPKLIKSVSMKNPQGLSLNGNILYICEGDFGLRVVDVSGDSGNTIAQNDKIKCTDVIALTDKLALAIGTEGFYMLDITSSNNIKILSTIKPKVQ